MTRRGGFTIIEAVLSSLIMAVVLTAAVRGVALCAVMRTRVADDARAQQLAVDMLAEVLQQNYASPSAPDPTGPTRAGWTCVDDYASYSESPPLSKAGNALADTTNLTRAVRIDAINPATLAWSNSPNTGVKRVTVTVQRGSLVLATAAGYRTLGWIDAMPTPTDSTGNHAPAASFTIAPSNPKATKNVTFNAAASSDLDNDALSFTWNFGDNSTGSGASIVHVYSATGTYTATLTVYDGNGGIGVSSVTITVTQ